MGFGGSIIAAARSVLLVAGVVTFATAAHADDCLSGLAQALANTFKAAGSSECETGFGESAEAVGALAAVVAAGGDVANQVCSDVGDVAKWGSSLPEPLASELAQLAGALGDVTAIAQCACELGQSISQLPSDVGSCIEQAFCSAANFVGNLLQLGNQCQTCSPPPPILGNCTPPDSCVDCWWNPNSDCAAHPEKYGCANLIEGQLDPFNGFQDTGAVIQTPLPGGGTMIVTAPLPDSCAPSLMCICPSPMTVVHKQLDQSGDSSLFPTYIVYCECPRNPNNPNDPNDPGNTHLATQPGQPSIPACICDNTGRPAQPPGSPYGICPNLTGPSCPPGQVYSEGACVTPCADPKQIKLANGTCCAPSQAAACGECCPAGQYPDPVTGNCATGPAPATPVRQAPLQPLKLR